MAKKISDKQSDFKGGTAMWHGVELRKMSREQLYAGFEEFGKLYAESINEYIKLSARSIGDKVKSLFSKEIYTEQDLEDATLTGWILGLATAILVIVVLNIIF